MLERNDVFELEHILAQSANAIGYKGGWAMDYGSGLIRLDHGPADMFALDRDRAREGIPIPSTDRLHHPDDIAWVKEARLQPVTANGLRVTEYRVIDRTNAIKWVQVRSFVTMDRYGMPIREEGVTFDVTAFKTEGAKTEVTPHAPMEYALYQLIDGLLLAHQAARRLQLAGIEGHLGMMLMDAGRMLAHTTTPDHEAYH